MIQSTSNETAIPTTGETDAQEEFLREVIERATVDLDFRERLIENPQQTLAEEYELGNYPGDFDLQFIENDGADLKVVLPDPVAESVDLDDEELEQVAGGAQTKDFTESTACTLTCDTCDPLESS